MVYMKLSESLQVYYKELGLDPEKIPDEKEFFLAVKKYYKSLSRKKDFSMKSFRVIIEDVYKDIAEREKELDIKEPAGKKVHDFLDKAGLQLGMLKSLLDERKNLLNSSDNHAEILKILKDEDLKSNRTKIKFNEGTVTVDKDLTIQKVIDQLEKGKDSPNYAHALVMARKVLTEGIREIEYEIKKLEDSISKSISEYGKPKKKVENKPLAISPFTEVQDAMLMIDTNFPVSKLGAVSKWLLNPRFLPSLFKTLTEKDEDSEIPSHTDIFVVRPELADLKDKLFKFSKRLNRALSDMTGFLNEEKHVLNTLPRALFEKYKGYRLSLGNKYSPEDLKKLTQWSDQDNDFTHLTANLPEVMHADREKLEGLVSEVNNLKNSNAIIIHTEWEPLSSLVSDLREELSDIRKLFTSINKQVYFKQWRKDDVPVQMRESYDILARYQDPGTGLKLVREKIDVLEKFLKGHHLWGVSSEEKIVESLKTGIIEDYLDSVQTFLNGIQNSMKGYFKGMDEFFTGLFSGSSLKSASDIPGYLRRMATMMLISEFSEDHTAVLRDTEVKKIEEESSKKVKELQEGKTWERNPKVEDPNSRSEYFSLKHLGLVYDPAHPQGIVLNFFQKSFPIEEILNEWTRMSGGKFLKAELFPKVIERLRGYLDKEIEKSMSSDALASEKKKAEDELASVRAKIQGHSKDIKDAEEWATKTFHEFDKAIQSSEAVDAARKEKVSNLDVKNKELGKKLVESLKAEPFDIDESLKIQREYNETVHDMRDVIDDLGKGKSPIDGKPEFIEKMKENAARIWNILGSTTVRSMNWIQKLEDKDVDIQNHINRFDSMIKEGPTEKQKDRIRRIFITELWNILDFDWLRKIREFQTHYNLNFDDYISIHSEVEKLIGGKVHSRAYARLKDELKKEIRFLRDKGMPIPKNLYDSIKKLWNRGEFSEEKKEVEKIVKEQGKEAVLYDYPTEMSARIASNFSPSMVREFTEMELFLR